MKKITIKNLKKKGFTLIELLITIAGMSLLASVAYMLYNVSNDDKNSDTEFKRLSQVMKEINDTTATTGIPPGINKTNLYTISNGLESTFSLNTVSSPNPQVLNFEYVNMNSKVCSNFTANMVNSADYVSAIINGSVVKNRDTVNSIISKCGLPNNEVTIVLNKYIDTQVISSVTPNINVSPVTPGVYNPPYVAPPVMPSTFTPPAPLTPFVPPPSPVPPTTKVCPDGSVIPTAATCPVTPTTKVCPDGSVIPTAATCPATTKVCPDGSVIPTAATCPATTKVCPDDGSVIPIADTCPYVAPYIPPNCVDSFSGVLPPCPYFSPAPEECSKFGYNIVWNSGYCGRK